MKCHKIGSVWVTRNLCIQFLRLGSPNSKLISCLIADPFWVCPWLLLTVPGVGRGQGSSLVSFLCDPVTSRRALPPEIPLHQCWGLSTWMWGQWRGTQICRPRSVSQIINNEQMTNIWWSSSFATLDFCEPSGFHMLVSALTACHALASYHSTYCSLAVPQYLLSSSPRQNRSWWVCKTVLCLC